MAYEIALKRTSELSATETSQIVAVFNDVFDKRVNVPWFARKYSSTSLKYSYHGLLLRGHDVVGAFNAIPYRYRYFGSEHVFALSVDTMILPEHRGGGHLRKMGELVHQAMIADGIPFILGFPNENYYSHEKRLFGTRDIAELDYYVLPINVGAVLKRFRFANALSRFVADCIVSHCGSIRDGARDYPIEKISDQEYYAQRYDESYIKYGLDCGGNCVAKTYDEEGGTRVTYVIDVNPLYPSTFAQAVRRTYRDWRDLTDMIMYVGKPPFRPPGLIKVPDSRKPQRVRMTGKILLPEVVDERAFDVGNWNVGLSNIDVR